MIPWHDLWVVDGRDAGLKPPTLSMPWPEFEAHLRQSLDDAERPVTATEVGMVESNIGRARAHFDAICLAHAILFLLERSHRSLCIDRIGDVTGITLEDEEPGGLPRYDAAGDDVPEAVFNLCKMHLNAAAKARRNMQNGRRKA